MKVHGSLLLFPATVSSHACGHAGVTIHVGSAVHRLTESVNHFIVVSGRLVGLHVLHGWFSSHFGWLHDADSRDFDFCALSQSCIRVLSSQFVIFSLNTPLPGHRPRHHKIGVHGRVPTGTLGGQDGSIIVFYAVSGPPSQTLSSHGLPPSS